MFAIGEAKTRVSFAKLELPKEYRLRRKQIYGVWIGDKKLYLSDEKKVLEAKGGPKGMIFEPVLDSNNRIQVPSALNKKEAVITGCIWTIEIEFEE